MAFTLLAESNADLVLVYGNPHSSGQFGFEGAIAEAFQTPFEVAYPAPWQGLLLDGGAMPRTPVSFKPVPALNNPALW